MDILTCGYVNKDLFSLISVVRKESFVDEGISIPVSTRFICESGSDILGN
jgi:hypothetical protein